MNISKDSSVYFVHYWPGSCGAFIAHLIHSLITGTDTIETISTHGNVHDSAIPTETKNYHVIHNHGIAEPKELYKTHSKRKTIIIQVYKKDLPFVYANFFYKTVIDSRVGDTWLEEHWDYFKNIYFDNIEDPKLATPEMVLRYINGDQWPLEEINNFTDGAEVHPDYYVINFRDIYLNKDKIINQLCEITGTSPNNNTLIMYNKYLQRQHIQEKINFTWQ